MTIWFVGSIIGLIIWAFALIFGLCVMVSEREGKESWQAFAAIATGAFLVIVLWPLVIPLALAGGLCYGLYCIVKLSRAYFRKEK